MGAVDKTGSNAAIPVAVEAHPMSRSAALMARIPAAVFVVLWIACSGSVILFNKWVLDTAHFRFPITLTTWHLVFSTLATQLMARTTTWLDGRHNVPMTRSVYVRSILPIGVFFSLSLICSNIAYLHLSVAFIQMLKATTPAVVLVTTWAMGMGRPSGAVLLNVLVIVAGVVVASYGEIEFVPVGVVFQVLGIVFESTRLATVQRLLSGDEFKMDPLVSVYYFAPVCALMNGIIALVTEAPKLTVSAISSVGYMTLLANAMVAFALNVSVVFLIGKTSVIVLTLSGVLKDILLVVASVAIWHTVVTPTQLVGYSVALSGLVYFKLGAKRLKEAWDQAVTAVSRGPEGGPRRRGPLVGSVLLVLVLIGIGFAASGVSSSLTSMFSGDTNKMSYAEFKGMAAGAGKEKYELGAYGGLYGDLYEPQRKLDIVMATYKENPESLRVKLDRFLGLPNIAERDPHVIVYTKDPNADIGELRRTMMVDEVVRLPNRGREGDTFLQHIVSRYDDLAEHTLFIQGDVHHEDKILSRLRRRFVANTGVLSLGMAYGVCDCNFCQDPWGGEVWYRLPEVFTMVHRDLCPREGIVLSYTGQHVVSARRIRNTELYVYERLLHILESAKSHDIHWDHDRDESVKNRFSDTLDNPFFGHTIERAWMTLFHCNDVAMAKECHDLINDQNVAGACQCYDA